MTNYAELSTAGQLHDSIHEKLVHSLSGGHTPD